VRIVYLLAGLGFTGGSLVLYRFMDELVRRSFEVWAVLPGGCVRWQVGAWRGIIERAGLGTPWKKVAARALRRMGSAGDFVRMLLGRMPDDSGRRFAWLTKELVKRAPQADVYVATYCATAPAAYLLADRARGLYHVQHFESVFFEDLVGRRLAEATYFLPLELIANSSWLAERLEKFAGRKPALLLPGIDTDLFRPRDSVRRKFSGAGKVTVVSYYSANRFKAWPEAVEAMRRVYRALGSDRVRWRVFGGKPPQVPDVPVEFVGVVMGERLAQLYWDAHIVFMNSWCESFPLPPLEGMACGAAVVTTRLGTEDYAVDGENAVVVEPRRPEEVADAIVRLAVDREMAARLGEAGVETARKFDWRRAGDVLEAILVKRENPGA
jgi:glycosyltransferase involved in cell wall biosynthesis